jgi:hypothetical protein
MAKTAKQNAKAEQFTHEFDSDYERIMRLAKLVNPTVKSYKEMVGDSQEIETITTYGAEVTIP